MERPERRVAVAAIVLVVVLAAWWGLLAWAGRALAEPPEIDLALRPRLAVGGGALLEGARFLSFVGDGWLVALLGGAAAWNLHRRGRTLEAAALVIALAGTFLLIPLAKEAAGRARPPGAGDSPAFPSGHALRTAALAGCLVALAVRRRIHAGFALAGSALALAVGWSRLALQVHWPTDVLAGWLAGGDWGAIVAVVFGRARPPADAPGNGASR